MTGKKRHSTGEIAAKLREADALISQGKRQQDVARELGISVMTFHRWRKAQAEGDRVSLAQVTDQAALAGDSNLEHQRIAELELENSRLRRLVTDLLLEKIKLEETSPSRGAHAMAVHPPR